MRRHIAPFVLLSLAGCGSDRPAPPGPDADLLFVNDTAISMGGQRIAASPEDVLAKIVPLAVKLTERREAWTAAHPAEPFPGELTIDLGPTLACRAALSVYMTAVRAGFEKLTVKQGSVTVSLPYYKPPEEREHDGSCAPPDKMTEYTAAFLANGDVELRFRRCGGAFDVGPAATLNAILPQLCAEREDCMDGLMVVCDEGVPMASVLGAIAGVKKAHPAVALGHPTGCSPEDRSPFSMLDIGLPDYPQRAPLPLPAPGKTPPARVVRVEGITVTGPVTPEEVESVVAPKLPHLQACRDAVPPEEPAPHGRTVMAFMIGKKGAVVVSRVAGEATGVVSSTHIRCTERVLDGLTFPAKGRPTTVTLPLVLPE